MSAPAQNLFGRRLGFRLEAPARRPRGHDLHGHRGRLPGAGAGCGTGPHRRRLAARGRRARCAASFVGPRPAEDVGAIIEPKGPAVDLSDIDPWRRATPSGLLRRPGSRPKTPFASPPCPWAATGWAATCWPRSSRAPRSRWWSAWAAVVATLIGTLLGALSGFFGGKLGDLLEWVYNVFTAIPTILLIFAFAAIFPRRHLGGADPWADGLDRHLPPDPRRVHQAPLARVRARAEAIGASTGSRIFRHILPNVSRGSWCSCRCMWWASSRPRSSCPTSAWASAWTRSAGAPCWPRRRTS